MGLGQNGQDFNVNGLVHVHGGTVTLPREVRFVLGGSREAGGTRLTAAGLGAHLREAPDG